MDQKKKLQKIIKKKAYKTQKDLLIISRKGKKSNWLMDLRAVLMDAEGLDLITELFWEMMQDFFPFQIGGEELSSVPLVSALLQKGVQKGFVTNGFIIRKERKKAGLCKKIEGDLSDLPIVLVDDLTNAGSAFLNMYKVIENEGKKVAYFFTIVNFQNPNGQKKIKEKNVKYMTLFNLADFDLSLSKTSEEKKIQYSKVKNIGQIVFAFPDYFHTMPRKSLLAYKDAVLFLAENASLYFLDLSNGVSELLYDSKTIFFQESSSNLLFEGGFAYWVINGTSLICLALPRKKIIWTVLVNNLQGEIKNSNEWLIYQDRHKDKYKLYILDRMNGKKINEFESDFLFSWFLDKNNLVFLNKNTLIKFDLSQQRIKEETVLIYDNLNLKFLRKNAEKVFIQNEQSLLILDKNYQLILQKDFSLINNCLIDDDYLFIMTVENELLIYKKTIFFTKVNLKNKNCYNFIRRKDFLFFVSDYSLFALNLKTFKQICVLQTVEKIISFLLLNNSTCLVHLIGNQLSYFEFKLK